MYTQIDSCRMCKSPKIENILNLGDVPLPHFKKAGEFVDSAPLELVRCRECKLIQLKHSVDRDELFKTYWYRSGINQTMKDALADASRCGQTWSASADGVWLDIGANDGTLLDAVPKTYDKVACEPSKTFTDELKKKGFYVMDDYFHAKDEKVYGRCQVITSLAMFYDLDNPNEFVANIAKCMKPNGVWVNQLSYTPHMFRDNAFDNICHEHVTYWDLYTLEALYRKHGLKIQNVTYNNVNGGSVRVVATKGLSLRAEHLPPREEEAFEFAERVKRWRITMIEILDGQKNVWGYGASTKGVTLLSFMGGNIMLEAVADRNKRKHGLIMPGSDGADIVSEEVMRSEKPDYLLVLPWAFKKEFVQREAETRRGGTRMLFPLPNPEVVL